MRSPWEELRREAEGVYTVKEAARLLHLSGRRIKQLKKQFRTQGEAAVVHGNAGKHPANDTGEDLRNRAIALKKNTLYEGANFTYFRELLEERENISVSYATLCRILKGAGIVSKRKHRNSGRKFIRRKRRGRFGELLQADATPFDWFGDGERWALHGFIRKSGLIPRRTSGSSFPQFKQRTAFKNLVLNQTV
jgi:transposase